jgi:hypothetical protein
MIGSGVPGSSHCGFDRETNRRKYRMKKLLLVCLALSVVFLYTGMSFAADSQSVKGWVSDTKCGAKGTNAAHAACAKKCVGAGEKLAIVSDADGKVLAVDNQAALAGHEGHHVEVKGVVSGDSIKVDDGSVKMLADNKGQKGSSMDDMHK